MQRAILIFTVLSSFHFLSFGQNEGDLWYFGKGFGLDFSMGEPVLLTDGAMNTHEGCASISDAGGNLLFYTDGITVWNRNHEVMKNGEGLGGHTSATQSAIIVPQPKSRNAYFIFTIDAAENALVGGLQYTLVSMIDDGGLGAIRFKNKPLAAPTCEKITAVVNQNQKDFWIITHEWDSDRFICFQVTDKGVDEVPVISEAGTKIKGSTQNATGYMKASPRGDILALANFEEDRVELFKFDNSTGEVRKWFKLPSKSSGAYGVEFSPSGERLYVGSFETGIITQYDLNKAHHREIIDSRFEINKPKDFNLGALQIGPDGKIYTTSLHGAYIGCILNPNTLGTRTRYNSRKIKIGKNNGRLGLPTFIQSFFAEHYTKNRKLKPRPGSDVASTAIEAEDEADPTDEAVDMEAAPAPAPLYLTVLVKEKIYEDPEDPNSPVKGLKALDQVQLTMDTGDKRIDYQLQEDGKKRLRLNPSESYDFLAQRKDYLSNKANFVPEPGVSNQEVEIILERIFKEKEITLNNIYYDYDKASLRSEAFPELDKLVDILQNNEDIHIQLSSHTDCRGEEAYNETLSQNRAQSVVNYLIEHGISEQRLVPKGYGESEPATDCACQRCSEAEHQRNRRTTFKIID